MLELAQASHATPVIQSLVAPVVMISAAGLLCLALYNRLAAVVSRLRVLHHERLQVAERLSLTGTSAPSDTSARLLRDRSELLEKQLSGIMGRAKLLRAAPAGLLVGIICMLACSLAIGLSLLIDEMWFTALGLFVLGVFSMLAAMVFALRELARALDLVALEHDAVERLGEA